MGRLVAARRCWLRLWPTSARCVRDANLFLLLCPSSATYSASLCEFHWHLKMRIWYDIAHRLISFFQTFEGWNHWNREYHHIASNPISPSLIRPSGALHLDQGTRTSHHVVRRVGSERARCVREGARRCAMCAFLRWARLDCEVSGGQRWRRRCCDGPRDEPVADGDGRHGGTWPHIRSLTDAMPNVHIICYSVREFWYVEHRISRNGGNGVEADPECGHLLAALQSYYNQKADCPIVRAICAFVDKVTRSSMHASRPKRASSLSARLIGQTSSTQPWWDRFVHTCIFST